jgi:putative flavoprotein involved in K+ transport
LNNPVSTASQQVIDWLSTFAASINRADFSAATSLFAAESYWRDLIAFTWNITTAEGQEDIQAMLCATVAQTRPTGWQIEGQASISDEVVEGWFAFETAVGRAKGHIRLKEGRCWTLFTTLQELKGFEEKRGRRRVKGTQHGAFKQRKSWLDYRQQEAAELGYTRQPN